MKLYKETLLIVLLLGVCLGYINGQINPQRMSSQSVTTVNTSGDSSKTTVKEINFKIKGRFVEFDATKISPFPDSLNDTREIYLINDDMHRAKLYRVISDDDSEKSKDRSLAVENPYKDADFRIEIIPAPNNTYGYDILMNGRIIIHQPHIPALPGIEGFKSEKDAQRVVEFIIHRIKQNIFPPSISAEELDSLGVLIEKVRSK